MENNSFTTETNAQKDDKKKQKDPCNMRWPIMRFVLVHVAAAFDSRIAPH